MKRFSLAALVLVAIIAGVLPAAMGILAEREIVRQLDHAPADSNFSLELDSYQRGWFSSTALLRLRPTERYLAMIEENLAAAEEQGQPSDQRDLLAALEQGIDFNADIVHGPLGWQQSAFAGLAAVVTVADSQAPTLAGLQSKLDLPYILRVRTLLRFDGTTDFVGDMPSFSYRGDIASLDFSGVEFDGRVDADASDVVMRLALQPGTRGRNEDVEFAVDAIEVNFEGMLLDNRIWIGDSQVRLDQLSLDSRQHTEEQASLFRLQGLEVRSNTRQSGSGDTISLALSYTLERLHGASLPEIEAVRMDTQIDRLDRAALDRYIDAAQTLGAAPGAPLDAASAEFGSAVYQLLSGSPALTLEPVSFILDGEPGEARAALQVDGENLPPAADLFTGDFTVWRRVLTGSGRLALSEPLAQRTAEGLMLSQLRANVPADSNVSDAELQTLARQQSQAMLAGLLHQGMLVRDEEMIVSEFDYDRGAVSINGHGMPALQ